MNLNDIHRGIEKHRKKKRVGRGKGSGLGKTSGHGHKGQGARRVFRAAGVRRRPDAAGPPRSQTRFSQPAGPHHRRRQCRRP